MLKHYLQLYTMLNFFSNKRICICTFVHLYTDIALIPIHIILVQLGLLLFQIQINIYVTCNLFVIKFDELCAMSCILTSWTILIWNIFYCLYAFQFLRNVYAFHIVYLLYVRFMYAFEMNRRMVRVGISSNRNLIQFNTATPMKYRLRWMVDRCT